MRLFEALANQTEILPKVQDGVHADHYLLEQFQAIDRAIILQGKAGLKALKSPVVPGIDGQPQDAPDIATMRFLELHRCLEITDDVANAVNILCPEQIGAVPALGAMNTEQLVLFLARIETLRRADLVRFITMWQRSHTSVSPGEMNHLHIGSDCETALLFHRFFSIDPRTGVEHTNEYFPHLLTVLSDDPDIIHSLDYMYVEQPYHFDLQAAHVQPIGLYTSTEALKLPPIYTLFTAPFTEALTDEQIHGWGDQMETIANPATGMEIIMTTTEDVSEEDWLARIATVLQLRDIAVKRGWRDVTINFSIRHQTGWQLRSIGAQWEIASGNDSSIIRSDAWVLQWLHRNYAQLSTAYQMPKNCGVNLIFYAKVPTAIERTIQRGLAPTPVAR